MPPCRLEILGFRTQVHLGVPEAERQTPQEVEFDVRLYWAEAPAGTHTDQLQDTLCYGDICAALDATAQSRPFALIEALGCAAYEAIRKLSAGPALEVTVKKLNPPIARLHGGAHFVYGDPIPGVPGVQR